MNSVIEAVVGRIKEKTRIASIFSRNACMRHGIPYEEDAEIATVQVEHNHVHEHKGLEKEREAVEGLKESVEEETRAVEGLTEAVKAEKILPVAKPLLPQPAVIKEMEKEKRKDWLKKGLIVASLFGGGVSVPLGIDYFFGAPSVESEKDGSLLQYLEDRGEHLPGGFGK